MLITLRGLITLRRLIVIVSLTPSRVRHAAVPSPVSLDRRIVSMPRISSRLRQRWARQRWATWGRCVIALLVGNTVPACRASPWMVVVLRLRGCCGLAVGGAFERTLLVPANAQKDKDSEADESKSKDSSSNTDANGRRTGQRWIRRRTSDVVTHGPSDVDDS